MFLINIEKKKESGFTRRTKCLHTVETILTRAAPLLSVYRVYLYFPCFLIEPVPAPGRVKHHPLRHHQQQLCRSAIHYRGPADEGARQAGRGMLRAPNTQRFTVVDLYSKAGSLTLVFPHTRRWATRHSRWPQNVAVWIF